MYIYIYIYIYPWRYILHNEIVYGLLKVLTKLMNELKPSPTS